MPFKGLPHGSCYNNVSYFYFREPMWEFCQLLSTLIPILHSGNGEVTTGWLQGPWIHCEMDSGHLASRITWWNQSPWLHFWSQISVTSQTLWFLSPEMVYFLSSGYSYLEKYLQVPFGQTCLFCIPDFVPDAYLQRTWALLQSVGSGMRTDLDIGC